MRGRVPLHLALWGQLVFACVDDPSGDLSPPTGSDGSDSGREDGRDPDDRDGTFAGDRGKAPDGATGLSDGAISARDLGVDAHASDGGRDSLDGGGLSSDGGGDDARPDARLDAAVPDSGFDPSDCQPRGWDVGWSDASVASADGHVGPPGPFDLWSPPDGADEGTRTPLYMWSFSAGATDYLLHVAYDPGFCGPETGSEAISADEAGCPSARTICLRGGGPPSPAIRIGVPIYWFVIAVNGSGLTYSDSVFWYHVGPL